MRGMKNIAVTITLIFSLSGCFNVLGGLVGGATSYYVSKSLRKHNEKVEGKQSQRDQEVEAARRRWLLQQQQEAERKNLASKKPKVNVDHMIDAAINRRMLGGEMTQVMVVKNEVHNGIVYMEGNVPSPAVAERAVRIARSMPGVRDAISRLEVLEVEISPTAGTVQQAGISAWDMGRISPGNGGTGGADFGGQQADMNTRVIPLSDSRKPGSGLPKPPKVNGKNGRRISGLNKSLPFTTPTDEKILAELDRKFISGELTRIIEVHSTVENGVVTLYGNLPSQVVAARAIDIARRVHGVKLVVPKLQVREMNIVMADGRELSNSRAIDPNTMASPLMERARRAEAARRAANGNGGYSNGYNGYVSGGSGYPNGYNTGSAGAYDNTASYGTTTNASAGTPTTSYYGSNSATTSQSPKTYQPANSLQQELIAYDD